MPKNVKGNDAKNAGRLKNGPRSQSVKTNTSPGGWPKGGVRKWDTGFSDKPK